jgi:hypothetical protein
MEATKMQATMNERGLVIRPDNGTKGSRAIEQVMSHNGGKWDGEMLGWWFAIPNTSVQRKIISTINANRHEAIQISF